MIRETRLLRFIKDECSNYDRYYQNCLLGESCLVFDGRRCAYFERNVLIVNPDYRFRLPGYDYTKLVGEYSEQTKAKTSKVKTRHCACGEPIGFRQRLCRKCKESKRRDSYRNSKRSKRLSVHS